MGTALSGIIWKCEKNGLREVHRQRAPRLHLPSQQRPAATGDLSLRLSYSGIAHAASISLSFVRKTLKI
jgi:hypothetical protein